MSLGLSLGFVCVCVLTVAIDFLNADVKEEC